MSDAEPASGPTLQPLSYATPPREPKPTYWLALLVFAAVMIRIAFSLSRPTTAASLTSLPDQLEYLSIGQSILHGDGVSFIDLEFDQRLYAYRMPGYPLFVAACGADVRIIRAAQALLDASAVIAIYLAARRLVREPTALLAAGMVAFNPYLLYFSSLILSETLFTAMLTWGVCGLLSKSRQHRIGGVLLLLLSVFVRPSAIGLGILAAGAAFGWRERRSTLARDRKDWVRTVTAIAWAIPALVLLLFPWTLRNFRILNEPIWTTTNGGYTAFDSFNPHADGSSNQAFFRAPQTTERNGFGLLPLHDWHAWRDRGEAGRSDVLNELAMDYAKQNPQRVVSLAFAKLGRFWSPVPLSADFGGKWEYLIVGGLYVVPLFVFSIIGLFRGGFGKRSALILLLPALYFTAVHSLAVGSLRYRVPCDVPLAVLAAAGVMSFAPRKTEAE